MADGNRIRGRAIPVKIPYSSRAFSFGKPQKRSIWGIRIVSIPPRTVRSIRFMVRGREVSVSSLKMGRIFLIGKRGFAHG